MFELVPATKEDFNLLYNYELQIIYPFTKENDDLDLIKSNIKETIQNNIREYWLIKITDIIVGMYSVAYHNGGIIITGIYVEKDYRNNGITTSLLKKEIDIANKNKTYIDLWVFKGNKQAISLYEKLGFTSSYNVIRNKIIMTYDGTKINKK